MIKKILGQVRAVVPVGFRHHDKPQAWEQWASAPGIKIIEKELQRAKRQPGTLGGGNHFIEIQSGDDGFVWLMIHSGSRDFGKKIADEYHQKALSLCQKWHAALPDKDLAFLPIGTLEAREYIEAMKYALDFAAENRRLMMERVKQCVVGVLECGFDSEVNIHHNYAAHENHFAKNVWVHRKGATSARSGQKGIIPGSMGTPF